jgi:hypothetical protein
MSPVVWQGSSWIPLKKLLPVKGQELVVSALSYGTNPDSIKLKSQI